MGFEQTTLLGIPRATTVPPVAGRTIASGMRAFCAAHPLSEVTYGAAAWHEHTALGAILSHNVVVAGGGDGPARDAGTEEAR